MAWARAAAVLVAGTVLAALLVSGGSGSDPRTPPALPGLPPPFLGTAVLGSGQMAAAIDAYGDVVDLRAPGPAGMSLISNPAARQSAGTVDPRTGIVPRVSIDGRPALPVWRADSVRQAYLPGTNVVRTVARFGGARVAIEEAAQGQALACAAHALVGMRERIVVEFKRNLLAEPKADLCGEAGARRAIAEAARSDRRWLRLSRQLGAGAPAWGRRMYARSLLVLHALTDRRSGAVAAGIRDQWAYVWPRDASAAAIALAGSGHRADAKRIARFLLGLDLPATARFRGDGGPVPGRAAEGDASGWVTAAARATGLPAPSTRIAWRARADYQEGPTGNFLANTLADGPKTQPMVEFSAHRPGGLVRRAGDAGSGLDSAAAWAVRPFPHPALFGAARVTLARLIRGSGRFGITPGEAWNGTDPWSAPTAWSAWSLAVLGQRAEALRLLADLRRAATPAGALPERVDAHSGVPRSTTPLGWSHAFAILALRQLWP